jgi:TetR/AcrR family transcriptional regulator, transcriptional repressor for nem operon
MNVDAPTSTGKWRAATQALRSNYIYNIMRVMTRYPAERKAATRARILSAAEAVIKDRGPQAATVEAVMRRAGLTVGGFYAHFASKEALAREALIAGVERSFDRLTAGLEDAAPADFARALIDRYLAQVESADLEAACPLTLLLPDIARGEPAFRGIFATRSAELLARVEYRLPAVDGMSPRDVALAVFAALTGAVAFARAAATPRGRRRIVDATAASVRRLLGLEAPAHS